MFKSIFSGALEFLPNRKIIEGSLAHLISSSLFLLLIIINYYLSADRERASYEVSLYFCAKSLAVVPIRIVQPFLFVLISYPMAFSNTHSHDYVGTMFTVASITVLGKHIISYTYNYPNHYYHYNLTKVQ